MSKNSSDNEVMRKGGITNSGGGIGGKVSVVEDPNSPTYDPATNFNDTQQRIFVCLDNDQMLSEKEKSFLMQVYGGERLSRKQHIWIYNIYKRIISKPRDLRTEDKEKDAAE